MHCSPGAFWKLLELSFQHVCCRGALELSFQGKEARKHLQKWWVEGMEVNGNGAQLRNLWRQLPEVRDIFNRQAKKKTNGWLWPSTKIPYHSCYRCTDSQLRSKLTHKGNKLSYLNYYQRDLQNFRIFLYLDIIF